MIVFYRGTNTLRFFPVEIHRDRGGYEPEDDGGWLTLTLSCTGTVVVATSQTTFKYHMMKVSDVQFMALLQSHLSAKQLTRRSNAVKIADFLRMQKCGSYQCAFPQHFNYRSMS